MSVSIRRGEPGDVDYLLSLVTHPEVAPFLAAVRASDRDAIAAAVARSQDEPDAFGLFVVEVDGEPAGTMEFRLSNRRSRIADLGGLALHPDFRGRGVADEAALLLRSHLLDDLGLHRLQLEVYSFNERALAHAERIGFTREGVRRKAYWRHGEWVDGVLFGLVAEDLEGA